MNKKNKPNPPKQFCRLPTLPTPTLTGRHADVLLFFTNWFRLYFWLPFKTYQKTGTNSNRLKDSARALPLPWAAFRKLLKSGELPAASSNQPTVTRYSSTAENPPIFCRCPPRRVGERSAGGRSFLSAFVRKSPTPSKRNPSLRGGRSFLHESWQKDPLEGAPCMGVFWGVKPM